MTNKDQEKANYIWGKIPNVTKQSCIEHVFCPNCINTHVVDYKINLLKDKVLGDIVIIEGKCAKCGKDVVRVVDWEI